MSTPPAELADFVPQALAQVRARNPLVQCLTNTVVTDFTANVLYAVGATPAMVDVPDEAGPFARIASAVLINLATPHAGQRTAMAEAARAAGPTGTPWVLDAFTIGSLPVRTALARQLLELRPTVVRGTASEIFAVAGADAGGPSADATEGVEAAEESARVLARRTGGVVAVSGPTNFVTDGARDSRIAGGHALLARVAGGAGGALGAVMSAFAAVDEDRLATTVAAVTVYSVASEVAAQQVTGPGSFAVAFLDALAALPEQDLVERAALS